MTKLLITLKRKDGELSRRSIRTPYTVMFLDGGRTVAARVGNTLRQWPVERVAAIEVER